MATVIKQCDCAHDFQDKRYGKNMRVHNESEDGKRMKCTVCKKVKNK